MNPFEYVDSVSYTKKDIMRGTENDDLAEKSYNPFIVNLALSYHPDSILAANVVNIHSDLPKRVQYLFLLNTLRPRKRFAK